MFLQFTHDVWWCSSLRTHIYCARKPCALKISRFAIRASETEVEESKDGKDYADNEELGRGGALSHTVLVFFSVLVRKRSALKIKLIRITIFLDLVEYMRRDNVGAFRQQTDIDGLIFRRCFS